MNQKGWKNNFSFVLLVYLAAHVLMLVCNGVWWDDYVVWGVTPEMLYNQLGPERFNNPMQYAYIDLVVNYFPLYQQIYVFRIIEFIIHGISLICCWFILKSITSDKAFTTMCCMLIAVYGLDTTSLLVICSHYSIANCLFFIGLLAAVKEFYSEKKYLLYLTGVLWLLSLLVWRSPALLMPLVLLFLSCAKSEGAWRNVHKWKDILKYIFVHYFPIIAIVMLFVPIYLLFLQPSGQYEEYYTPQFRNLITTPFTSFISAVMAVVLAIGTSIKSLADSGGLLITCTVGVCVLIVCWYWNKYICDSNKEDQSYKSLAGMAFLYLMVSMMLQLSIYGFLEVVDIAEYKSRLLSLGAFPTAIIITYLLYFFPKKVRNIAFAMIMIGMATYTTYAYINYIYAWNKTEIITEYFRKNPEMEGKNIFFIDQAFEANENESNIRFYAYEGMARMAYGVDTKTRVESKYISYYGESFEPDYVIYCYSSHLPIKMRDKCKLVLSKWLHNNKYQQQKKSMLLIEHKRYSPSEERTN